jgi:ethanolamine ammonia-lyase small subunit
MSDGVSILPKNVLREATPARLALGRVGDGMPTDEVLRFGWAHATARDAVHAPLDVPALQAALTAQGWEVETAHSRAVDRATYLRRPDLGRRLEADDALRLGEVSRARGESRGAEVCIVIADGLSSLAVQRHGLPLLEALKPLLPSSTRYTPVVIAVEGRVALGDEIGEALAASLVVVLIGERPGLSSPDSLGIYLTHGPRKGRNDAQRNCISNVRPEGLPYRQAAEKLAWLIGESGRLGLSGVDLKDESHLQLVERAGQSMPDRVGD